MTRWVFGVCLALVMVSCSKYQQVTKNNNYDDKEKLAMELYQKKRYARALPLFEELITVYRGTSKAEGFYYYYAYCNFGVADYLLANYWFEYFVTTYPFSPKAEECEYMAAYCFYKDSPREPLEQTNTIKAIRQLQSFIDAHPQSNRVAECNTLIDKLRKKLENKDFRNAYQFYNMEYYTAAVVSFQNLLKDYPETDRRQEVGFYIVKSAYLYAMNSVRTKKKERLLEAAGFYDKYCRPNTPVGEGKYEKEAKAIKDKIDRELKGIEVEEAYVLSLEKKAFDAAMAEYTAGDYKKAIISFEKLLREYPQTPHLADVSFCIVDASYQIAMKNTGGKKKLMLVDAKNNYTKFAGNLGGTPYAKEGKALLAKIEAELKSLADEMKKVQ